MNDSEYALRWRTLAAQLGTTRTGRRHRRPAAFWRDALRDAFATRPAHGGGAYAEHTGNPHLFPLDAARLRQLRASYFSVSHASMRRNLIAKQRELELFERTGTRTRLEDARRQLESVRRRPSEGWWIAAIVGASLVIVGYELFAMLGAIAAGVAALFVGNGIEQGARRRFEQAVAFAEEDLGAAVAAASVAEQSRDVFSESESATGQADEDSARRQQSVIESLAPPPTA